MWLTIVTNCDFKFQLDLVVENVKKWGKSEKCWIWTCNDRAKNEESICDPVDVPLTC